MNNRSRPGQLFILSAPSGAGKTTLAHRFVERVPGAQFSVSVTTRPPRVTEKADIDYHFVDAFQFDRFLAEGALAEWAQVHGHRYGTLRRTVEEAIQRGNIAVFDIDVQGGSALKNLWPRESTTVFVLPPSPAELERRLRGRSTDSDESISRRLAGARREIEQGLASYDWVIVNDDLNHAVTALNAIAEYQEDLLLGQRHPRQLDLMEQLKGRRMEARKGWRETT